MRIWLLMVYLIAFVHTAFGQKIVSFLPETHTETAVIVCSGGSYFWSANETESDSVARTLQEHGIAAYVLHYRTGGILPFITHSRLIFPGHQYPMPLDDLRQALDSVRRVGYGRVGVMGFSAGGHLALAAALFNRISLNRCLADDLKTFFNRNRRVSQKSSLTTLISYISNQLSGIHTIYSRNIVLKKELRKSPCESEIGRIVVYISYDKSRWTYHPALEILVRYSVISNQRIGHNYSLICIGRIRNYLLVAGHGCIEDYLTYSFLVSPEAVAQVLTAVLKYQFFVKITHTYPLLKDY